MFCALTCIGLSGMAINTQVIPKTSEDLKAEIETFIYQPKCLYGIY